MAKNSIIFIIGVIVAAIAVGYLIRFGQEPTLILGSISSSAQKEIQNEAPLEELILDKEEELPLDACLDRGLSDKIIILETEYCGACKIAVPQIKEIEQEFNKEFIFLNLSKEEDAERLKEFKIIARYTPTVLIGCNVYIGAYPKEQYKQLIEDFLSSQ